MEEYTYTPQYGDYTYANGFKPLQGTTARTTVGETKIYSAPKIADLSWNKQSSYTNPSAGYETDYLAGSNTSYGNEGFNKEYGVDQQKMNETSGTGTLGWINAGISATQSIANIYNAYQSNKLARKTFNFNKDMMERNYNMVLDEYNQRTRRADGISRQLHGESFDSADRNARSYSDRTGVKPK